MPTTLTLVTTAVALSLSVSPTAAAEDGEGARTLFGHPVKEVAPLDDAERARRAEAFDQMLDDKGWVHIGDQVLPQSPDGGFAQPTEPFAGGWDTPPHRSTIFLNFFGDTLVPGTNADMNESPCVNAELEYPGFSGTEQQALALIQVFETQMAPYGVRIAYEERPPGHLPYAMVMMGGSPGLLGLPGGVLGVSCSSDCGDFWWRDLTFAFTDNVGNNNAEELGTTALHEAAHAFGLAHIDGSTNIMFPFVTANSGWADGCTPYNDATGGINCQPTHDEFCGAQAGMQDTNAELMAYFGPNSVDMEPPVVEITSPADGLEIEVGGSVMVEADISDNHEGVGWKLVLPEAGQEAIAYGFERQWPLGNLPEGVFTIRVEALDHERNEAFDEVTIYVGVEAPTGADSSSGEPPGGTAAESTGVVDPTTDPDGTGSSGGVDLDDDTGDEGCGCQAPAGGGQGMAAWMLLLGLGIARRRRAGA